MIREIKRWTPGEVARGRTWFLSDAALAKAVFRSAKDQFPMAEKIVVWNDEETMDRVVEAHFPLVLPIRRMGNDATPALDNWRD